MPTGYTAGVTETTTLAEFALECARAFGALITMRDDPHGAPVPDEFKPSDHHVSALAREEARLAELRSLSAEQAAVLCAADHANALVSWRKSQEETAATRARYERLLGLVAAWQPPTPEHVGLRDFMIEQLQSSIKFDCTDRPVPPMQVPAEWLDAQIKSAEWGVTYHRKEDAAERDRAKSRTEWVRALRESLVR